MTPTASYRAIMLEVERRRVALGLPMEKFSEFAGLPERYYTKALHADSPSGRQAQWGTMEIIVRALFPHGYDLEIRAKPGCVINEANLKAKLLNLKATIDPKTQRQLMSQLGRAGRAQQLATQSAEKRSKIARRAAKARWRKPINWARAKAAVRKADHVSDTSPAAKPPSQAPENARPRSAGTGEAKARAPRLLSCSPG